MAQRFLLGLGAGILAATLVIGGGSTLLNANGSTTKSSANAGSTPNESASPSKQQPMTADDVKKAAQQAGLLALTQKELDDKLAAAKTQGAQQKEAELAQQPRPASSVHVCITPGMGTNDVALLLQAAGVLENGNALIQLRQSTPNSIRAGVYDLPLHADPQEILKTLTTPPKKP